MTAAVSGALLVGLIAGVVFAVVWGATCGPECSSTLYDAHGHSKCLAYGSTCGDVLGRLFFSAMYAAIYAIVLGTLPGIAALTLTPAKVHPWRSLVVLVPASVIGFALWYLLQILSHGTYGVAWLITLFLLPTTTGLIAACTIGKLPWGLWARAV